MGYRWLSMVGLCGAMLACSATAGNAGSAAPPGEVIAFSGTVTYVDLEGGFFGIITDQGQRLDPRNLPEGVRRDRLKVAGKARVLKDVMTFRMWGTVVDIIEIAPQ